MSKLVVPELTVADGEIFADSRDVAAVFEKNHKEVLRAIRAKLSEIEPVDLSFAQRNFALGYYVDENNQPRPKYDLTKDGFTTIALGFTGEKATEFQIAYVKEFNRMLAEFNRRREWEFLIARSEAEALRIAARKVDEDNANFRSRLEEFRRVVVSKEEVAEKLREELSQLRRTHATEVLRHETEMKAQRRNLMFGAAEGAMLLDLLSLLIHFGVRPFEESEVSEEAVAEFFQIDLEVASRLLNGTLRGRAPSSGRYDLRKYRVARI